jgi:transposase
VDDFSLRRGQTHATIIVDLERHEPIDLLPDRSAETLADWLRVNPGIEVVARDRYRPYIEGASAGAPEAVQVADRFHILKNLYDAVERAVERNRHALREPDAGPGEVPVPVPERSREAGHPGWGHRSDPKQREERLRRYQRVVELRERGLYVEDIAGEVGLSQSTVVSWLNAGGFPERKRPKKKKPSPVAPYAEYLERRWNERCINMSRLWREIKGMGYEGSYDAVADHLRCLRKGLAPPASAPVANEQADGSPKGSRYESQEAARLLMLETKDPETLRPEQCTWLEELRRRAPKLAEIQELAGRFAKIMREGQDGRLGAWLDEAQGSSLSEIRTFARGVRQDEPAIRAAITLPYSNGQVEGQVNRLKLIKRSMYGRASFGLLRQRVLRGA